MISRFFIDRPIFASVLSIVITLAGAIALFTLPVTQYPEITPPTVEVSAYFPGAHAITVVDTVASPIEEQVNGVEGMMYMSSQCTNDGTYKLTVTFKPGTDLNLSQVLVQNRVNLAQPRLPDLVKRRGVLVTKKASNVLMIVNLVSTKPPGDPNFRDPNYLSNYATIQLRDALARLPGVGDITILGQRDYSMRVWLDPQKMTNLKVGSSDVQKAIEEQNVEVAAGQIGQPPVPKGQVFQFTINTLGRLSNPEQFADMVIKTGDNGQPVRMRDITTMTEMGALSYDQNCTLNGKPSVAMSVYQLPGTNALDTARGVRAKMEELRGSFPDGVDYEIVYDTTPFITESVSEVRKTLIDAVLLVALVMLVFLQSWRSAIIPLVAVPVAIVGTFAAMAAVGFSLNSLTLFGLVLAIGIVVDDAIVVVEAIEHHIETGLSPKEAAYKAMEQVSGPVIAVGLVLSAVFIPCAFIPGIVGQFFRQFAVTVAISTLISAFNSLTLSPALAAILLKPRDQHRNEALPRVGYAIIGGLIGYLLVEPMAKTWAASVLSSLPSSWHRPLHAAMPWIVSAIGIAAGLAAAIIVRNVVDRLLVKSFRAFNIGFAVFTEGYVRSVKVLLRVSVPVLLVFGGLLYLTYELFINTPTGYIPGQDKGYLIVNVTLKDASSQAQTRKIIEQMEKLAAKVPGVKHTVAIAGQSMLLNATAPNVGSMYVMLDDFPSRAERGLTADVIAQQLQDLFDEKIDKATVHVFGAPPIEGLGTAGGFKIILEDHGELKMKEIQEAGDTAVDTGNATPGLTGLFSSFRADVPWLELEINRDAAKARGVSISEVFSTLQGQFGSYYVNDFNRFGRTWQVTLQADEKFRAKMEGLRQLEVKNSNGDMVPLLTFAKLKPTRGPLMVVRYNMYAAAAINGNAAPGTSSGEAIELMEQASRKDLPPSMRPQWTEIALLQQQAGNTAMLAFVLAVVLVFLVLAAQYESWTLPLAVILVVPMCLLCAVIGVIIAKHDINIFSQVGFVVLVGLACKNAILIVEFAKQRREAGAPRHQAVLEACRLRIRPIMMTSFAFIIGVVPLLLSNGAGAEMRRMLGTAVFAGMLGVTLFGIFLTPVFFNVIQWFADRRAARLAAQETATTSITQ
jgi:multidrug efflux pump subunit AcrB